MVWDTHDGIHAESSVSQPEHDSENIENKDRLPSQCGVRKEEESDGDRDKKCGKNRGNDKKVCSRIQLCLYCRGQLHGDEHQGERAGSRHDGSLLLRLCNEGLYVGFI